MATTKIKIDVTEVMLTRAVAPAIAILTCGAAFTISGLLLWPVAYLWTLL